ncbi:hypothetical protein PPROV_000469900 [Pycnococcus provasolii]|uniref:Cyanobacterial aminoacyl-tRNA synthetase CAAD domain-containing protein n=1 Tax=Pycnococcus provasolii TaxID=41880 RepID=A0A830HGR2_9CHLO|nr:hypothetical protein PPROV_000469900 [Pycnococcus provasolii]|mmetsp:Transcript_2017/g.4401  ORF Transcript_2017/g.4401 Transcript_2017/m.4401 type:complete len:152 (-) Transcript_2017:178-633(-)|eukprot:CAMPEP_0206121986 /NCGR_PEP_ID=MMETSP1472-20131121/1807_1 /ASSEMBLY_ACC=CAM_ASM_001108 /TAXON_ID=41880 /ORGANISM="Pycnococcus provasolii, Strain RCC251" /LENGTH=151 /DNA_ID=CAMNT_0053512415 /DNA_START=33 /DNA_END=488 /DNA_ORIENTATION=-
MLAASRVSAFRPLAARPVRSMRTSASVNGPTKASLAPSSKKAEAKRSVAVMAQAPKVDPEEIVKTLSEQWDKVDNKGNALLIGGGGIFALWLASTVVGAINSVPLLPKLMELVGFGYSAWFVYKYLLFKEGRIQAASDFDELKEKISGITK